MANNSRNTRNSRVSRSSGTSRRSGPARTSRTSRSSRSESFFSRFRRPKYEFKPDNQGMTWLKRLYLTRLQRLNILKWSLYALLCVLMLVIQDVIMSKFNLLGATTDLAPAAILLISVLVGSEHGSIFALIASTVYWFSGSAPGAYCIALISFASIGVSLFRQAYWRRGFSSTVLCAGAALMVYEIGIFLAGVLLGLTQWGRIYRFALTAAMSWAVMIPLYPLCFKIGQIGGEPWKE